MWPKGAGGHGSPRGRASLAHWPDPAHWAPPRGSPGNPRGRPRSRRAPPDGEPEALRGQILEGCRYWLHTGFRHFTSAESMGRTWKSLSIMKPPIDVALDAERGRASSLYPGVQLARIWVAGV